MRSPLCFVFGCVFGYAQVHKVWSQRTGVSVDDLYKKTKLVPTTLAEPDNYKTNFFQGWAAGPKPLQNNFRNYFSR